MTRMGSMSIRPKLLYWACKRAGHDRSLIRKSFPSVSNWRQDEVALPVEQLEDFASKTYTSVISLAFDEPLEVRLPFIDYRSFNGRGSKRPTPHLLDTVRICRARQDWYRDYARAYGHQRCSFVGSADLRHSSVKVAQKMGAQLNFTVGQRAGLSQGKAFGRLVAEAEEAGVLVMVSSCVGYNASRRLDSREFRGFALPDAYAPLESRSVPAGMYSPLPDAHAPLVFVNSADATVPLLWSLAHALAHLWLGKPAISNLDPGNGSSAPGRERWCNAVAGELLVPGDMLRQECTAIGNVKNDKALKRLARKFKVSNQVILIRLRDIGAIAQAWFRCAHGAEMRLMKAGPPQHREREDSSGSPTVETVAYRSSRRFVKAIVGSNLKRETLYTDAIDLIGLSDRTVFERVRRELAG